MRIALILLLLIGTSSAQSIVVSGGRSSIVISGHGAASAPITAQEADKFAEVAPVPPKPVKPPPAPVHQQSIKPNVDIWTAQNFHCPPCETMKGDIAKGALHGMQISWRYDQPPTGRYPCLRVGSAIYDGWSSSTADAIKLFAGIGATTVMRVVPKPVVVPSVQASIPRYFQYGNQMIDLETYVVCGSSRCGMCKEISARQQAYLASKSQAAIPAHQQPTPDDLIDDMLRQMQLRHDDVLCDLGCGDARILIAAYHQYGCRGIGVEIDPIRADEARRKVAAAGLSDKIRIHTGDVLDFDPTANGVTAIVAYLYPDLLQRLIPAFRQVRVSAFPFHDVPGLVTTRQENSDIRIFRNETLVGGIQ